MKCIKIMYLFNLNLKNYKYVFCVVIKFSGWMRSVLLQGGDRRLYSNVEVHFEAVHLC